ncbi:uncharacterized protein C5L36_0A08010 [Pichia kudriavzevii]|uniref:CWF19-like protein DRN1 n=1 Tax=Pichia kudriavzevii TaxID=4909 RepID=A0A2U9QYT9_PICKU|nr:uncharacterized protein C5L36_0A08010 [Pichia kudriavzevii]AWU74201.1 hypothetical protein C5L36_0A08010 [Pichia kudriavzevii]
MPQEKLKILVFNPATKNLAKAVNLVNRQQSKAGPFEFALFLGDVFTENNATYVEELKPEIPIYYSEGEAQYKSSEKLHENFNYLGEIGVLKLANGLKIGYVTGDLKNKTSDEILSKFKSQHVDILLTYLWPDAIAKEEKLILSGEPKLDCLIDNVQPRYWFACGGEKGRFFEREPYSINGRITRFISLAAMDEGRWYYAFQISLSPELLQEPIGPPPIVFKINSTSKRTLTLSNEEPQKEQKQLAKPLPVITSESCFLCLSNPNFELHMVIHVGNMAFLTVTKGPLTPKQDFGFSGHGMIVPINHHATLRLHAKSFDDALRVESSSLYKEITKYEENLTRMFRSLGDYSVIFWEISRKRSVHSHIQFLPVKDDVIMNFEKVLQNQIEFYKRYNTDTIMYKKFESTSDMTEYFDIINSEDYVSFTVHEKTRIIRYLIKLGNDDDKYFDAQFPRKVVAILLNLKHRIRWNKCIETVSQESEQKQYFKNCFRKFDILKGQGCN